jgi:hypothetical protein
MGAYACAARLSSGNHVTAKFCADELVLYALAVEASLSFISEEESWCNSYAKFVFVWRQQKFCSAILLKLCRHCMNGEWWMANAASQQGNSWCCMLCLVPNSVLADAHQSLMMPGQVVWTLQSWLSSVAIEPASCRSLSSVTDLRLLCAGNHCGEHSLVFPSQVGANCWKRVALLYRAAAHPNYWQYFRFAWDPGGCFPEITCASCGASIQGTHCNFILNVGIPFQFPLYVTRSCGKQRKPNGGNVNVVSGVGTLFQNGVAKSRASTVAHMNQMMLHVTVH